MKFLSTILMILFSMSLLGCLTERKQAPQLEVAQSADVKADIPVAEPREGLLSNAKMGKASLTSVEESESQIEGFGRKVIKSGELTLEVTAPNTAQQQIGSIASSAGGFVVTSEMKQLESPDPAKQQLEVALVVRVPATQFDSAFNQIRALGSRVILDKTSGQDVTEEFIDLEARIKTQKALEAQFLEIMKQASKVEDALEVQRQIAEVRSDIERLEGRKRFLQNRSSLSTITVNLRTPRVIAVNTSSFGHSVREAVATGMDLGTGIVLLLIRSVIVLMPIFLLLVLPGFLIGRYVVRRAKFARRIESVSSAE